MTCRISSAARLAFAISIARLRAGVEAGEKSVACRIRRSRGMGGILQCRDADRRDTARAARARAASRRGRLLRRDLPEHRTGPARGPARALRWSAGALHRHLLPADAPDLLGHAPA